VTAGEAAVAQPVVAQPAAKRPPAKKVVRAPARRYAPPPDMRDYPYRAPRRYRPESDESDNGGSYAGQGGASMYYHRPVHSQNPW
jgi:hypothetical protein